MVRALAILAAVSSACGGLDNRPLQLGAVSGTAAECDGSGVVGVVGDSAVRVVPDASCGFRIEGIAPGSHELFVAPTAKKVALVTFESKETELTDVGQVVGQPGAFERLRISTPMGTEIDGQVEVPGLPLTSTAIGRSGMVRIGPFPAGCFVLEVSLNGLGKKAVTGCLAEGEEQSLDVAF
jgi:hypothetical protein